MLGDFKSRGFDAVVVGKAFDDDLYVYVRGSVKEREVEYYGLHVDVTVISSSIEEFEKSNWYMQSIDEETVMEAIKEDLAVKDGVGV